MGFWGALQIIFDVLSGFGIFILLLKLARAPKDDPRLSRGLQILQSKIAILEDLSDRTENQVRGLMSLLDQKNIEVQTRIDKASNQVIAVEASIRSSMDVAKIFQDKIPHQEIIERKNTLKYLQAAKLANQGQSAAQIAQVVELPMGEIEFIAKVNRDQLTFSMEDLPPWAKAELAQFDSPQVEAPAPQETESSYSQHPYSNDLNYLGNSIDERNYDINHEIAPLSAYANEPQFQAFRNFYSSEVSDAVPTIEQQPVREMSALDNKQLSTLKRTQSIIASLDKQFSMSGLDVQEDNEEVLPPTPQFVPQHIVPPQAISPPVAQAPRVTFRDPSLGLKPQSLGSYDSASIRRVIFPTINAQKANRSAGK